MATEKSSAGFDHAHPPADQDHPHACLDGFVYLGYVVEIARALPSAD
jgi:hypothetical protein